MADFTDDLIDEKIKKHDNFQFEIKQSYSFPSDKKKQSYYAKIYFFIPINLNINRHTYTKHDFYRDLHSYIRLKTPVYSLESLAADGKPMRRLAESVNELLERNGRDQVMNYEYHLKMFCLIMKKALWRQARSIQKGKDRKEISSRVDEYIGWSRKITDELRTLKERVENSSLRDEYKTLFKYVDEYSSLKIESNIFKALTYLENKRKPGSIPTVRKLSRHVMSETGYRRSMNYPGVVSERDHNEYFLYRQGILKKLISNVLYLETHLGKGGTYLREFIYASAAGIAMVFATAVAYISQWRYGNLTLPFFIALVVGYMFKDRIKESMRVYLNLKVNNFLYDRTRNIYQSFSRKIGLFKESVHFVNETNIPESIIELRKRDSLADVDNSLIGEEVMLYRKYIKLKPHQQVRIKGKYPSKGVIDIIRINVEDFLRSMDNPYRKVYIPEKNGFRQVKGRRVYHINMISYFVIEGAEFTSRFRIVLNREGIQRIEEIK